jgi:hypothetical protein
MIALVAALIVSGAILAVLGAVDAYRGRMREDPKESGLYTIPDASPRGLILASIGAAVSLASGLAGLTL